MNFDKLKERVGFSLAIYAYQDELSEEFFDNLTFEQWFEIHQRIRHFPVTSDQLKKIALDRMSELADNFDQWWKIYELSDKWQEREKYASFRSELRKTALDKMSAILPNFEDWLKVCREAERKSKLRWVSVKRMSELAEDLDQWLKVYKWLPWHSTIEDFVVDKISEQIEGEMERFDQWLEVCDGAPLRSKLREFVLTKLFELAESFDQWAKLCESIMFSEERERGIVLDRMSELAETFNEWEKVYAHTFAGTEFEKKVLDKMSELAPGQQQQHKVSKLLSRWKRTAEIHRGPPPKGR